MAHFVAFCIGFQKNIPLQNPPGGYMAAQGLIREYPKRHFRYLSNSGDTFLPLLSMHLYTPDGRYA